MLEYFTRLKLSCEQNTWNILTLGLSCSCGRAAVCADGGRGRIGRTTHMAENGATLAGHVSSVHASILQRLIKYKIE